MKGCFKRSGNPRKIFNLSPACLCVQPLYIPTLTLSQRGTYIHFIEVLLPDDISRHFSDIIVGVSTGVSKTNLVDYYYPEDTHMMYLNQQEEMLYQKNKKHSGKSADKTK